MIKVTNGANAYRGFIFISGTLLASCGYVIAHGLGFDSVYSVAGQIADGLLSEPADTFGYRAYTEGGFGGIRREASGGFTTVKFAQEYIQRKDKDASLLSLIPEIVARIDDSVLLKRSGNTEKYNYFKKMISECDVNNEKQLLSLNELCVRENISIGGSADVLIAGIMMQKLKEAFFNIANDF